MNQSDFDRLKEVCEKEGFEITAFSNYSEEVLVSKKKDIWEGVEFCKVAKIHKIKSRYGYRIYFDDDTWSYKDNCKPSTEQAYVEQLKAEAFRRFGEIKEGDEFDQTAFNDHRVSFSLGSDLKFSYSKDSDNLFIGGCAIYYQGKWAARLPERVKVERSTNFRNMVNDDYTFNFTISQRIFDASKAHDFLAQKLEEYLNQ